ncbi:MAG: hypothetical protein AAF600_18775 [Bacteroidota bacterium]
MIRSVKHFFIQGNRFYGIDICHVEGTERFFLLKLKKQKGELVIDEKSHYDAIQDVIKVMETSVPVFVSLNTKGVLTKVADHSSLKGRALANTLFPNMDEESLYFESYTIKNQNVISIVRKEELNSYLEEFQNANLSVYSISLGLSGLEKIISFFQETEIHTHSQAIQMDDVDGSIAITKNKTVSTKHYDINDLKVDSEYVLSLGAILRGLYTVDKEDTNLFNTISNGKKEYSFRRIFSLMLYLSISLVLGVLLINFMFFSYYHSQVEDLREQTILNESGIIQLKKLNTSIAQKESRLEKALSTSSSKISLYLDQLAQKVPGSILLEEITYQPLAKPIKPTKYIEYSNDLVMVSGTTSDNLDFTNWIGELERLPWTQSVETMEYDFQNKKTSFFHLRIKILDEAKK